MKKLLAILLAAMMLLSFVACGETVDSESESESESETDAPEVELAYKSAEELLSSILYGYSLSAPDESQLWVNGGNIYNFETLKEGGPAKFVPIADEDYNTHLGYPAADVAKIDDAASMFHMLNANTFTCYAVHFTDSADVDAMVDTLKTNISAREWECGHPEKLYIVKVPGDYLVVVWGVTTYGGVAHTFAEMIPSLVENATIVVDISLV